MFYSALPAPSWVLHSWRHQLWIFLQLAVSPYDHKFECREVTFPQRVGLRTGLMFPAHILVHTSSSAPEILSAARTACDHKHRCYSCTAANQRAFVSISVQAFFQGDSDAAVPCPGSAAWVRLRHPCGHLEHGLPGRAAGNACVHGSRLTLPGQGQRVLSAHLCAACGARLPCRG